MPVLTPSERRGALMVLALCALGAAWDLLHARPFPAPPAGILAPATSARAAPEPGAGPVAAATGVDLNRATAAQLDALPGIGPVLALRIVEQRGRAGPFRSADELLAVRGIGPHLLERLRPLVTTSAGGGGAGFDSVQIAMPSRR